MHAAAYQGTVLQCRPRPRGPRLPPCHHKASDPRLLSGSRPDAVAPQAAATGTTSLLSARRAAAAVRFPLRLGLPVLRVGHRQSDHCGYSGGCTQDSCGPRRAAEESHRAHYRVCRRLRRGRVGEPAGIRGLRGHSHRRVGRQRRRPCGGAWRSRPGTA